VIASVICRLASLKVVVIPESYSQLNLKTCMSACFVPGLVMYSTSLVCCLIYSHTRDTSISVNAL
jgi:hypothetical protein